MDQADRPLIVGAGPVGLAAALFTARQGRVPRIVEMQSEPSPWSRALAVNPRTLSILEPTGVSRQMLELGLPIRGVRFYRGSRTSGSLSLGGVHPRYPFMLALSQAATERLLTRALETAGGRVERGVRMVRCRTVGERAEVTLEASGGGPAEVVSCPWMLAADGAHSAARQQLGFGFPGSTFAAEWHLADAPLRTALAVDHAHAFFLGADRFLFLIRVVGGETEHSAPEPLWRVIGNRPRPLSHLVQGEQTGPAVWTSSFHVAHRVAANFVAGRICLAGDAAHIHSPLGARGMNLGVEDAWVFSELARTGRLAEYGRERRRVDSRVVRKVGLLTQIVSPASGFARFARSFLFPLAIQIPLLRKRMLTTVAGLDHPLSTDVSDETN